MRDYIKYWQLWHDNWDDTDLKIIRQLCDLQGKDVVEIGCGDGRLTFKLAPFCRSIVGVDVDARFIALANEKKQALGTANIEFLVGNAENLSLMPDSADLILFPWVLHEVKNTRQALLEALRTLRENGRLIVIGLRSDTDSNAIRSRLVNSASKLDPDADPATKYIDPEGQYKTPIREVFGNVTELDSVPIPFRYFFESREIACDAFDFSLEHWCNTKLDDLGQAKLRQLIDEYWTGERIELVFPASVYLSIKENSAHGKEQADQYSKTSSQLY